MNLESTYDFAIIGAGAAGMNLALSFANEPFFDNKRILILDPNISKEVNKKWSFWQQEPFEYPDSIEKQWKFTQFKSENLERRIALNDYTYYTIDASKFLNSAYQNLKTKPQFSFELSEVQEIIQISLGIRIRTSSNEFVASHVFDSRVPEDFFKEHKFTHLKQHFKGWIVETEQPVFDDSSFTMMDFSVNYQNTCSFMYVLPFSANRALLEFTFFNSTLVREEVYDLAIQNYLEENLECQKYKIIETEQGVIPMSDYPFEKHHLPNVTLIGTAGGWVKPSTGYSFKASMKFAEAMTQRIIHTQPLNEVPWKKRGRWYDAIFLEVLRQENESGSKLFETMYTRNSIDLIFRFLDEESSLIDELKIILSFPPIPFLKALFRVLFR